ncbi:MAG: tetratricopeptide repeat protein [Elusimicrobiales bacterium]|nr:tetratricopeptide repeat protein [Elusimicrobiales bacterium]
MGLTDTASTTVTGGLAVRALALALACLLAGCAGLPRPAAYRDALSPEEHARLGTAYEAQGLRQEALKQYQAAVRGGPKCAECWLALGNYEFTDGRFGEAGAAFRKALKAAPQHSGAANNLAMTLLADNGSLTEAEALGLQALQNAGALRPYVLDTLANIFLRQGRCAEAAAAIDKAEAGTPADNGPVRGQLLETRNNIASNQAKQSCDSDRGSGMTASPPAGGEPAAASRESE